MFNNLVQLYAGKKKKKISGVYYVGFRMEICTYVLHIACTSSPTHSECFSCTHCVYTDCWHASWAVMPLEILDQCFSFFWIWEKVGGKSYDLSEESDKPEIANGANQKSWEGKKKLQ